MSHRVARVPREVFRRWEHLVEQRTYTNPNPVVRWLFWARLRALVALGAVEGGVALDFGCGEGALLPTLAARHRTVIAADLDVRAADRLVRAWRLENVRVTSADGTRLPLRDASIDCVVAADVLEHFADLAPPLAEIHRVMRGGGVLLVSSPMEHAFYEVGRRVFRFTAPPDHFQTARTVAAAARARFTLQRERHVPFGVPAALAAFHVMALVKAA